MLRVRSGVVAMVAVAVMALASCALAEETSPSPDYTNIVPDEPGRGPVDDEVLEREWAVIQAVEYFPYETTVEYVRDAQEVFVTVWTLGDTLPDQRLEELQERARKVAGEANVVVELIDDEGNEVQW